MKRIAAAAAAAGAGLAVLIATPAQSIGSPSPAQGEFTMPAPTRALGDAKVASGESGSGAVYEPVRAPSAFTMLEFEWSGQGDPGIAVRVSPDGSDWGPWTTVPGAPDGGPDPGSKESAAKPATTSASEPVWAGESQYLQYRLASTPSDLQLRFVNTDVLSGKLAKTSSGASGFGGQPTGTGTSTTGTGTSTGTTESTSTDPLPPKDDGDRRHRNRRDRDEDDEKPDKSIKGVAKDIIPRKKWDPKNDCKPRTKSKKGEPEAVIVHHTVNANDYDKKDSADMVLGICRYHRNSRGWDDIGYNFVVDRFGQIFEGRAGGIERANVGAQAIGFNETTLGVANLGDFEKEKPTKDALKAQGELIKWLAQIHDFPTDGKVKIKSAGGEGNRYDKGEKAKIDRISGHRDVTSTDCPGSKLYGEIKKIRKYTD